jgi:hypothetical protein
MIPYDSPLRNPPDSMLPIQKVVVDGLRYAVDMIESAVSRLHSHLLKISLSSDDKPLPQESWTECFSSVWSIVDNLWRFDLLIRGMPGLKQTAGVRAHLQMLHTVEDFRHGFQHLDDKVKLCTEQQLPLWGTLGWTFFPGETGNSVRVFLMIPGALRPGEPPTINPAGKQIARGVDLVTLTAFGNELQNRHDRTNEGIS